MPVSKYPIAGLRMVYHSFFYCFRGVLMSFDNPTTIEQQINLMKKYIVFTKRAKIRNKLLYTGYFRLSRYGKYLLSHTSTLRSKPTQDMLYELYDFDCKIRMLLFSYCKKAEIQFKTYISNAVSIKENNSLFYLDESFYTATKSANSKEKREKNSKQFKVFLKEITEHEKDLRKSVNKFPELKEYRTGGRKKVKKIPAWTAFYYFDLGIISNLYSYLRGDLRKYILKYGYKRKNYGKETTKQMDTWLDAIRNLRNTCAHHNIIVGKTSSVVLAEKGEEKIISSSTDLFSRLYALKKILSKEDGIRLKKELHTLIEKTKFDVFSFGILPIDWEDKFDRIKLL